MRHLTLVPRPVRGAPPVPTPQQGEAAPAAPRAGDTVAYVPVKLLLAASGRCSCDDCALEALRERHRPPRPARGTDRQPVRNLHLLS
jgi:hypothetical protein